MVNYGDRAQAAGFVSEEMIREAVADVIQKTSDNVLSQEEVKQAWEMIGCLLDLNPTLQDESFGKDLECFISFDNTFANLQSWIRLASSGFLLCYRSSELSQSMTLD